MYEAHVGLVSALVAMPGPTRAISNTTSKIGTEIAVTAGSFASRESRVDDFRLPTFDCRLLTPDSYLLVPASALSAVYRFCGLHTFL